MSSTVRSASQVQASTSRVVNQTCDTDAAAVFCKLAALLGDSQRTGTVHSVVLIDIDFLGAVNTAYGLGVGDRVLALMDRVLTEKALGDELTGHWAGDQFLFLLPGQGAMTAYTRTRSVNRAFRRELAALGLPPVSASAGGATAPTNGGTNHQLIEAAHAALKAVKHRSCGQVAWARAGPVRSFEIFGRGNQVRARQTGFGSLPLPEGSLQ